MCYIRDSLPSTSRKGRSDKRLSCRLLDLYPGLTSRNDVPAEHLPVLREHIEKQGFRVASIFASYGGPQITFLLPADADRFMALGSLAVPSRVSKHVARIEPLKEIPIERPFELVVTGARDFDQLERILVPWIKRRVPKHSFIESRTTDLNSDLIIFSLASWADTLSILRCGDDFRAKFPETISPPRLLWDYNDNPLRKTLLGDQVSRGADQISGTVSSLVREVRELRGEVQSVKAQQADVLANQKVMFNLISDLDHRMSTSQQAILLQSLELRLRSQIGDLETQASSLRVAICLSDDSDEKADLQATATEVKRDLALKRQELAGVTGKFESVTGVQPAPAPPALASVSPANPATLTRPSAARTSIKRRKTSLAHMELDGNNGDSTMVRIDHALPLSKRVCNLSSRSARASPNDVDPTITAIATSRGTSDGRPGQRRIRAGTGSGLACYRSPSFPAFSNLRTLTPLMPTSCFLNSSSAPVVPLPAFDHATAVNSQGIVIVSAPPSCSFPRSSSTIFLTKLILYLLLFSFLVTHTHAQPALPPSQYSVCALNANGLVSPIKIAHVGALLTKLVPHFFALSETKTRSSTGSRLPLSNYEIFEELGVQCSSSPLAKWGIVLGIRKDIQVVARVPLSGISLRGRVVAVDVIIPSPAGASIPHRVFAVYAPCDPNLDPISHGFWEHLTDAVRQTSSSWSLFGDLNATVSAAERASDNVQARRLLMKFLTETNGADLWYLTPDRNRHIDWTCRGWCSHNGGNIIDRVIVSQEALDDFEIHTDPTWVPGTDHRAIVANIVLRAPLLRVRAIRHPPYCPHLPTPPPRFRFPGKLDKHKFSQFAKTVDRMIEADKGNLEADVTTDASFVDRYKRLTKILDIAASSIFGRNKRFMHQDKKVTSPLIQRLVARTRHLGGAISIARGHARLFLYGSLQLHDKLRLEFDLKGGGPVDSFTDFLIEARHACHRDLYAARKAEIIAHAQRYDRGQIIRVLQGTSSKKLLGSASKFVPLPTALCSTQSTGVIETEPSAVVDITRKYFTDLYKRSPPPDKPKPWLTTPSVAAVRQRVEQDPFVWPILATLPDFRAMLRKGSPRPSPGPDGWEKWCVKNLSDRALSLVLDLHNYIIINLRFPGDLKDTHLTYFHKRGVRTELSNWRGLLISNFLANSPMTWLNFQLSPYAARMGIIPDTQVATQPGVQTRDLMSFLSSLKTWSRRSKTTLYLLKRDQMKGFDYLSPSGFYDACEAYGLPSSIRALDQAAQSATRCFPRTAFGIAEPIVVDGVTKQGGPMSPFKSTITTSLGHRYLNDIAQGDPDAVVVSSGSYWTGDPHQPIDSHSLTVTMTEATDDSYLVAKTHEALCRFTLKMERFQFSYGWLTSWAKTSAHVINSPDPPPKTLLFPSVTNETGIDPWTVTEHRVPVLADEFSFLRTQVDDPKTRYTELRDIIDSFGFPNFSIHTPFTLIRKLVSQCIISCCRALLSLQPILHADAVRLDQRLMQRVHELLGFPFCLSHLISTLPLSLGGFDFPSIACINASIAVDGLAWDLNHHIPAYRLMAHITLADWTCQINRCCYPLDGRGLKCSFSRFMGSVPSAWIIAQGCLAKLNLSLRPTDQSHLLGGDCSLSHALALIKPHLSPPDPPVGHALRSLRAMGCVRLKDFGAWTTIDTCNLTMFKAYPPPDGDWSVAQKRNWSYLRDLFEEARTDMLFDGQPDLMLTRTLRRLRAESDIYNTSALGTRPPTFEAVGTSHWGTDGSMIPASAGPFDDKSVTAAATGPRTVTFRLKGRNVSILHGELMGLIAGLIIAGTDAADATIHTDHLNSVRIIEDSLTMADMKARL
ncbi:hypothetical protein C0993_004162 [Termitomyces sp. T159_Od127]|nr:hypothetical protein C0993_004162 [Termitomyces sp. T159_Od127]